MLLDMFTAFARVCRRDRQPLVLLRLFLVLAIGVLTFAPAPSIAQSTDLITPDGLVPPSPARSGLSGDGTSDGELHATTKTTPVVPLRRAAAGLTGVRDGDVLTVDVNSDGAPDIVAVGADPDGEPTASVYLGDGQGSFTPTSAGLHPVTNAAVAGGDLNADGNVDLVVSGTDAAGNARTHIYEGDGTGGFTVASGGFVDLEYGTVDIADVDDDGNLDVLLTGRTAAGSSNATTRLYLGQSDGSFTEVSSTESGLYPFFLSTVEISDIDVDGNLDVFILGRASGSRIFFGNGDGTFTPESNGSSNDFSPDALVRDVNGDGYPDLLIASGAGFFLQKATAPGSFQTISIDFQPSPNSHLADGDLNGDGHLDVVHTYLGNGTPKATVYYGDGAGNFTKQADEISDVAEGGLAIADLDGDGDDDLVTAGAGDYTRTEVYINQRIQAGSNQPPRLGVPLKDLDRTIRGVDLVQAIAAGDPDGDDVSVEILAPSYATKSEPVAGDVRLELVVPETLEGESFTIDLRVTDTHGAQALTTLTVPLDPYFVQRRNTFLPLDFGAVSTGDLNNDGAQDIVLTGVEAYRTPVETVVYLGNGDGTYASVSDNLPGAFFASNSLGDVNNDGNLDLLITGSNGESSSSEVYQAELFLGDGTGSFSPSGASLTGVERGSSAMADFNEDGNLDMVISGYVSTPAQNTPSTTLYLGNGDGTFTASTSGLLQLGFTDTEVTDFNNDGHLDIAMVGYDGTNRRAVVHLGDGTGAFTQAGNGLRGSSNASLRAGDLNNDGTQDLVITATMEPASNNAEWVTRVYLGNGDGSFTELPSDLTWTTQGELALADLNGDANLDLLLTGVLANLEPFTGVFFGDGNGGFDRQPDGLPDIRNGVVHVFDADGDANPDIFLAGTSGTSGAIIANLFESYYQNPLPVEMGRFVGHFAASGAVALQWTTLSETNNARFHVERRADRAGTAWVDVGSVAGGGTTSEATHYTFTDRKVPADVQTVSYRLRQVDVDGAAQRTEPITVSRGSVTELALRKPSPNPVRTSARVGVEIPATHDGDVRLEVFDLLGRRVQTTTHSLRPGVGTLTVETGTLTSGTYFLRLTAGDQMRTQRMTVVR